MLRMPAIPLHRTLPAASTGRPGYKGESMNRPARDVAHESLAVSIECFGGRAGVHCDECDRLTAAIEADRREVIEAAERAITALPVVGIATVPYASALTAAARAVRSLSPKGTTPATKEVTRG